MLRRDHPTKTGSASQSGFIGKIAVTALLAAVTISSVGCDGSVSLLNKIVSHSMSLFLSEPANGKPTNPVSATGTEKEEDTPTFPPATDIAGDWDKPDITLFVTGRLHGYIEPCGCTGLANQKGGLLRRRTCQKILLDRGWDLVNIDAGNQIRRTGQQARIKLTTTYSTLLNIMNYQAIAFGVDDLSIPSIDLLQTIYTLLEDRNPFLCANVGIVDADEAIERYSVVQQNGNRIAITSVVGDEKLAKLRKNPDLKVKSVNDALREIAQPLVDAKCDISILTMQSSPAECRAIAEKFPIFDLVICSDSAGDPTDRPTIVQTGEHTTSIIQVGVKGMHAGIVGIYRGTDGNTLKYERVPMDARFEDAKEIRQVFRDYQTELKLLWENGAFEDIRPRTHPSGHKFVGSVACADCHDREYEIWAEGVDGEGGPHAKATRDLTNPGERTWVTRNFDPECVSCHAVGWNPQEYFPYETGFLDLAKDADLHGNGCENCHGPGSAHVESEESGEESAQLRKEMVVTKAEAKATMCLSCHDLDNSPDYALDENAFDKFWPAIAHGEDD